MFHEYGMARKKYDITMRPNSWNSHMYLPIYLPFIAVVNGLHFNQAMSTYQLLALKLLATLRKVV